MATAAAGGDRLGEILLREGLVTREQLAQALAEQKNTKHRLGYVLVKLGLVKEVKTTRFWPRQYRMPAFDLTRFEVDPKIIKLVPAEMATKNVVLPLKREGRTLTVAMADPTDLGLLEDLKFITRFDLFPVIAGEYTLRNLIEKHYEASDQQLQSILKDMEESAEDVEVVEEEEDEAVTQAQIDDAPVVKLINGLLTDAVRRGASDIHIEPFEHEIRVRYRIDGALLEIMRPPLKMKAALTSRVKILSQLNIAERRIPQDGRLKLKLGNRVIDFRVSTLPVLFTGPTGSGKTTTLYSALSRINTPEVNIMTAEDPVEYNLMGINQVLVRTEIGLTFAAALKAFLRQDPNIIMIGEIRDLETGGIAIKAALTGHLVLSTLHTNDAPSTITRMIDMGIEAFNVASAVNLVVAQRLVRRICKECKGPAKYTEEQLHSLGTEIESLRALPLMKGSGCETCSGTGYKGRAGLYEVMALSPELRRMILRGASVVEIRDQAVSEGMLTLRMDGMKKIERGITTLEEVVKETAE